MDGADPQQPEGLEDQLRRMIVNNPIRQPIHDNPNQVPTVRLPPPDSYPRPQQPFNQPVYHENGQHHRSHGSNGGRPHDASSNTQYGPMQSGGSPQHQGQPVYPIGHYRQAQLYGQLPRHLNHGPVQPSGNQRARFQRQMPLDPNAFQRAGLGHQHMRNGSGQQLLFDPSQQPRPQVNYQAEQQVRQEQYLEQTAAREVQKVQMSQAEQDEKDAFRATLEKICHEVCESNPEHLPKVSLECFGSFKSGFATAGSDMDLVIVVKDQDPTSACFSLLEEDLPRELERRLLQLGYGARLLTRTRVPIIKICEKPNGCLLDKLRGEREKWDALPNEKKYPHLHAEQDNDGEDEAEEAKKSSEDTEIIVDAAKTNTPVANGSVTERYVAGAGEFSAGRGAPEQKQPEAAKATDPATGRPPQPRREDKNWTRERKAGPLDFPKSGVGIQSDINFFNPLGLHNTQMLRCYSLCDPRVRPMVIFVKAWAKRRKINSSYSGTLSSYGHVLMVLHYLVNVARPPVLPNLQAPWRPSGNYTPALSEPDVIDGWSVNFWRNEDEITHAAQWGFLTANRESLGSLLTNFFHYYASQGGGQRFQWTQEVLSLRSIGGLLTKEEKGWVKATTLEIDGKRIQNRYLFCIEDPFELDHNVARTVTHNGIVAIRDEFRRAHRILLSIGNGVAPRDGELFDRILEAQDFLDATEAMKAIGVLQEAPVNGVADQSVGSAMGSAVNQQAHAQNEQVHRSTPPAANQQAPAHTHQAPQQTQHPRKPVDKSDPSVSTIYAAQRRAEYQRTRAQSDLPRQQIQSPPKPRKEVNGDSDRINITDTAAFPSLAPAPKVAPSPAPKKKKAPVRSQAQKPNANVRHDSPKRKDGEVSGDQAKKILADVRRRKDEAAAEQTASSLAEAVLGDEE